LSVNSVDLARAWDQRVYDLPVTAAAGIVDQTLTFKLDPLTFPTYWKWGAGMDLGIDHPWAYVLMAWDIDEDVIHVVAELRVTGQTPGQHFALIRGLELRMFNRHMDFPISWPADAGTRDKGSGEPVKNLYKQYGLRMMPEAATHANLKGVAANSLEGGVQEIDLRERASAAHASATSKSAGFITGRMARSSNSGTILWQRLDTE
jgi:hypothetical protein